MAGHLVQARSAHGNGASTTLAFLSSPTAGNLFTASVAVFGTTISTPTHAGDTFAQIGTGALNGSVRAQAYYAKSVVGGATTVSFSFGAGTDWCVAIEEWSGLDPTAPLDSSNQATGTSAAPNGGSVTATLDGVVWGFFTHGGATSEALGEGANFVIGTEQEATTNMPGHTENRGDGGGLAAGAYTTPATIGTDTPAWSAISAAFKAVAAASDTLMAQICL